MKKAFNNKKTNIQVIIFATIVFLIGIIGCICYQSFFIIPFYYAGCLFFFIGILLNIYAKEVVLLFTHGLMGYLFMPAAFLILLFLNPVITDINITLLIIYLAIILILSILGFTFSAMYSLNKKYQKKKYALILPFTCLSLALLITAILPVILK